MYESIINTVDSEIFKFKKNKKVTLNKNIQQIADSLPQSAITETLKEVSESIKTKSKIKKSANLSSESISNPKPITKKKEVVWL